MFGISFPELVVIVVLILVVMGPEKIPDVARTLGKVMREVRRASNLMRDTLLIDEDEYERNRARRIRQAERESVRMTSEDSGSSGDDAAEIRAPVPKKSSTLGARMPGGSLDQVDDEMLTASFEAALSEMYDTAEGGLRHVSMAPQQIEPTRTETDGSEGEDDSVRSSAMREVTLLVQGAAPGCRDVHLMVGEQSRQEVTW